MNDMCKAEIKALLHEGNYSCVIQNGQEIRTFCRRGVIDLYELYETEREFMHDACVADKVIGKGAAALLALGKVTYVHADVASRTALDLLQQAGIDVDCDQTVPYIINRQGNGRCPLETACHDAATPEEAYPLIRDFVQKMFYSHKEGK